MHPEDVVNGVGRMTEDAGVNIGAHWTWTFSAASVTSDLFHFFSRFVPNYPEMISTWAQIICFPQSATTEFISSWNILKQEISAITKQAYYKRTAILKVSHWIYEEVLKAMFEKVEPALHIR